ncbi:MAG: Ldh family oxidoreductase, partial [Bacteroidota bacterium]|nr:Ldh family oxidoreductase [Bacteroidota bacterium]
MINFDSDYLKEFTFQIFRSMGCPDNHARVAADCLNQADLRGVDSHGVARLSGYVRLWELKRLNATPEMKIIHETPSTAVLDGDSGLGLVTAPHAMQIAIDKAKIAGTGWVAVQNSNHYGIAGYHSMLALEHDMIGISMTNASPLVAPTFSKSRFLGTNPIAVAIPALNQPPFVIDMATSTVANGKLVVLQGKGE